MVDAAEERKRNGRKTLAATWTRHSTSYHYRPESTVRWSKLQSWVTWFPVLRVCHYLFCRSVADSEPTF